jgi:hypothetical protein
MPSNKTEKQRALPLLPVIKVLKGATQEELDKAYCRAVKAQEHGKKKFLAPGEIINEYISRGIWGQVGAKIVIFLSYCAKMITK